MKISISGSRYYNDYQNFSRILRYYKENIHITHINIGDAKGVDSMCVRFCQENNINYTILKADWNKHGKAAGPIRNDDIIKDTLLLIAFPLDESKGCEKSKGTWDAINKGIKNGLYVHVYPVC